VNVCRFADLVVVVKRRIDGFDAQLKRLVMGNPKFRGYLISRF